MARVIVVGAGFVGTATGTVLKEHGHDVRYVDVNPDRIAELKQRNEVVCYPEELTLDDADFVFVSVPTPTVTQKGIVLTHAAQAAENIGRVLKNRASNARLVVVFRSTMLPGSTRSLTKLIEKMSDRVAGRDFGVAYMPEYLRERHAVEDFRRPRLILLGCTEDDRETRQQLHGLFDDFDSPAQYTSYEHAEYQKYVHNLLNAVKISYFNEMRLIGQRLGLDEAGLEQVFLWTVHTAEAMWRPSYGTHDLGPYGGNCLPKDVEAMLERLRELGFHAPVLEGAAQTNDLIAKDRSQTEES